MWATRSSIAGFVLCQLCLLIIFQEAITAVHLDFVRFADEAIAVFGGGIVLFRLFAKKRNPRIYYAIVFGFLLLFVLSLAFGRQHEFKTIALQMIIHFKFFFFYVVLRWFVIDKGCFRYLEKILLVALLFSVLGVVLNILMGERFWALFSAIPNIRAGVYRYEGFQLKPNDVAFFFAAAFVYFAFKFYRDKKAFMMWGAALFFGVLIYLNGSRTALLIFPMTFVALSVLSSKYRIVSIFVAVCVTPFLMLSDQFSFFLNETVKNIGEFDQINDSMYIRAIMIYNGFKLLLSYFPIGSGAATFGSIMSENSVVYEELGLANLTFFQDMWGVYDSNLATICGEFGAVGLVVYGGLIYFLYKDLCGFVGNSKVFKCYFVLLLAFGLFVMVTNPFFMYQYNSTVFGIVLLLGVSLYWQKRDSW